MSHAAALPTPRPEVRDAVRSLLTQSQAFAALPPEKQRQIAKDTATIANYLAAPEGIEGNRIANGLGVPPARALVAEGGYQADSAQVDAIGKAPFQAGAAREGVGQAIAYIQGVNFPAFVGGLISGVFQSIVATSIQQMEEYGKMIAGVAQSLGQFMQDNVSENQGRDHLAEKFPDLMEIGVDDMSDDPQPKLKLRDGVDEGAALARVNSSISFENGALKSLDLSDENVERALVVGARMQLAKQRQQLMASMVLLGINRIVVTDGKIAAKVLFDFQAADTRKLSRSAQAYDMARDQSGNVQTTYAGEGSYDGARKYNSDGTTSSSDSYAKGTYKYENRPIITAMSAAREASEDSLKVKASLSGSVEVNFKSDYLPLEKMATPGMIAAIQGNSTPVDPNVLPSARVATPAAPAPAPAAVARA
jgi:hypothetical protein